MTITKHRMLGRKSSHRVALLRNLVTSLITHESISTTYPKAKEAQMLAEKVITMAKKNTEASRLRAQQILFVSVPPPVWRERWALTSVRATDARSNDEEAV